MIGPSLPPSFHFLLLLLIIILLDSLSLSPCSLFLPSVSASVSISFGSSTLIFDRCFSLDSTFTLCSLLNSDSSPPSITLLVQSASPASGGGWIGFGFSPRRGDFPMVGSSAVIGRASRSGDVEGIDNFELTQQDPSGVIVSERRLHLIDKAVHLDSQGILTMVFTRPLLLNSASFASIVSSLPNSCIWALGPLPASSTSPLSQHLYRNFGSVDFSTGSVSLSDRIPQYQKVHAYLMGLSFLLFLTSGILLARFGKAFPPYWYYAHIGCQLTALMAATAGFGIGVNVIGTGYYTTHRAIGITAMVCFYLQVLNVPLKPHLPTPGVALSTQRRVWNFVHHNTGRIAYILGIINVYIGMVNVYVVNQSVLVGVTFGWGLLIAIGAGLEFTGRGYTGSGPGAKTKASDPRQWQSPGNVDRESIGLGLASSPAALVDEDDDYTEAASRDASRDNSKISGQHRV